MSRRRAQGPFCRPVAVELTGPLQKGQRRMSGGSEPGQGGQRWALPQGTMGEQVGEAL